MTGAIVTSSGDHHRGFHQCPNVLRDKYMPLIGGDGYGYLNYLLSWANTNATLSVRRMKKDLAWSQDKLQRVQAQVLEHCAHFVSMTPGDRVSANSWHLDMEKVWLENHVHMGQSAAERLAKKGVPEIGTRRKSSPQGVPETGTEGVPKVGTGGVPEIGTYKDTSLNTPKKTGGEYNLESNARANQPQGAPVVEPGSAPVTTSFAARETAGGQTSPAAGVAVLPPDGGAADAAVTDSDLKFLFGDQVTEGQELGTVTEVPEVLGGAVGPLTAQDAQEALSGLKDEPHDPEATRALLLPALGGEKRLNALMQETPPSLKAGGRRGWIMQITPERAAELISLGRQNAGSGNQWTYIIRLLDEEVGAQIRKGQQAGSGRSWDTDVSGGANFPQAKPAVTPEPEQPADVVRVGTIWEHKHTAGRIVTVTAVDGGYVELDGSETVMQYLINKDFRRVG
ncbi:hypothetical protein [Deinococcus depolymerans]|uniref:Uncharacterized protein n=1 Tax=Deinococcus depolymerans TaxID=392408 RepID=A0ABP3MNK3_9DEIO